MMRKSAVLGLVILTIWGSSLITYRITMDHCKDISKNSEESHAD